MWKGKLAQLYTPSPPTHSPFPSAKAPSMCVSPTHLYLCRALKMKSHILKLQEKEFQTTKMKMKTFLAVVVVSIKTDG